VVFTCGPISRLHFYLWDFFSRVRIPISWGKTVYFINQLWKFNVESPIALTICMFEFCSGFNHCVYFKRLKRCVEITKMCADRDPSKRPTVEEMFLMLNGTQTMRKKVLPVATAPRNDTRSSLYRVRTLYSMQINNIMLLHRPISIGKC